MPMRCFVAGLLSFIFLPAIAAGSDWTGTWDTRWRDGGARLELRQAGKRVEGAYATYKGTVDGSLDGKLFKGQWHECPRSGGFDFVLSADGNSFVGRYDTGEWWTVKRVSIDPNASDLVDLRSPRAAIRTFLRGGNAARYDAPDELLKTVAALDFGDAKLAPGIKLEAVRN